MSLMLGVSRMLIIPILDNICENKGWETAARGLAAILQRCGALASRCAEGWAMRTEANEPPADLESRPRGRLHLDLG
jgi:hypothetical protein